MDDGTISQEVCSVRVNHSARKQVKCIFFSIHNNSVSGIGTTIKTTNDIVPETRITNIP